MTRDEIVAKVKTLHLSKGSYLVFGSAPLAALGIREAQDIDLFVSPEIYQTLADNGWQKLHKSPRDAPYIYDVFEAHDNWDFGHSYNPALDDLVARAMDIDDVLFASIADVREWKVASGRPKDLADVALIDRHIGSNNSA